MDNTTEKKRPSKYYVATIHHPAYQKGCGKVWFGEEGMPLRMEATGIGMITFLAGVMIEHGIVVSPRKWDYEFLMGIVQFGCTVLLDRYDHDDIHDIKS